VSVILLVPSKLNSTPATGWLCRYKEYLSAVAFLKELVSGLRNIVCACWRYEKT
jgi:hypothetical protein